MPRRKWRQVAQVVVDRRQTQQRELSACGVPQCGQRQTGMGRSSLRRRHLSRRTRRASNARSIQRTVSTWRSVMLPKSFVSTSTVARPDPRIAPLGMVVVNRARPVLVDLDLARDDRLEARDRHGEQRHRIADGVTVGVGHDHGEGHRLGQLLRLELVGARGQLGRRLARPLADREVGLVRVAGGIRGRDQDRVHPGGDGDPGLEQAVLVGVDGRGGAVLVVADPDRAPGLGLALDRDGVLRRRRAVLGRDDRQLGLGGVEDPGHDRRPLALAIRRP